MEKIYVQIDKEKIELVGDGLNELLTLRAELLAENAKREADLLTKAVAKEVATAKLEALGLTTDDLKALGLGSN